MVEINDSTNIKTSCLNYSKNEDIVLIANFKAKLGITTNDFGSTEISSPKEPRLNQTLLKFTKANVFGKIHAQHGADIAYFDYSSKDPYPKVDAIIADLRYTDKIPLLLANTADCPIIAIADQNKSVLALIHSGWKGSRLNIVGKTVDTIVKDFEINPKLLTAYIWPGISQEYYQVSPELKTFFGKWVNANNKLDLKGVILEQLLFAGLSLDTIYTSKFCAYSTIQTYRCHSYSQRSHYHPMFFSYRRVHDYFKAHPGKKYEKHKENVAKKRNCVFLTI